MSCFPSGEKYTLEGRVGQAGLAVLQAAGVSPGKAYHGRRGDPPPVQAFQAFTARVCGQSTTPAAGDRHVERFLELLWNGIGAATP